MVQRIAHARGAERPGLCRVRGRVLPGKRISFACQGNYCCFIVGVVCYCLVVCVCGPGCTGCRRW